jgi:hypothetical protein
MPFNYLSIFKSFLGASRCRQTQPHVRLDIILRAQAIRVHEAEIELRQGLALIGGEAKPFQGHRIVLHYTIAIPGHDSEIDLGQGVALAGGEMIPVCTENLIRVDDVMELPKLAE